MTVICIVCQSESPKYKCSTCYALYCSSGCWKVHKNGNDCKKLEKGDTSHTVQIKKSYVTEDTIPHEKMKKLCSNNDLKRLLKDPLLQKLLIGVDSSSDPYEAVQEAMQDSSFVQFVDLCLGIVEEPE